MASIRSRAARIALAGGMLVAAAFTLPAHAAGEPAPVLKGTSLANGWSRFNSVVSALYDSALVRARSGVTLVDRNGASVDGVTTLAATDKRILVFTPDDFLSDARAPYTVTFSAHALGQDAGVPDTVDTITFRVDTLAPRAPSIAMEPVLLAGAPSVIGPSDTLKISGEAADSGLSGIARIELRFFNPVASVQRDPTGTITGQRFDEITALRVTQEFTCSGGICPTEVDYSFTITTGLPAGYWTVKTAAVDLAGNVSGESSSMSFLWAKA